MTAARHKGSLRQHSAHRSRAFTLMEVLITMAIFLIGMVAVASVFPVASRLQKQTIDDMLGQQVARNATALLGVRRLEHTELLPLWGGVLANTVDVQPMLTEDGDTYLDRWNILDRSYPSIIANEFEREYYWVPLLRRKSLVGTAADWQVFAFILRRDANVVYDKSVGTWANPADPDSVPGVVSIAIDDYTGTTFEFDNRQFPDTPGGEADQVRAGDEILDNNGVIYRIKSANSEGATVDGFIFPNPKSPTTIWYGRPSGPDELSPARRILVLEDVVTP